MRSTGWPMAHAGARSGVLDVHGHGQFAAFLTRGTWAPRLQITGPDAGLSQAQAGPVLPSRCSSPDRPELCASYAVAPASALLESGCEVGL